MPWGIRRHGWRRTWGLAAALGAALISVIACAAVVTELIASTDRMEMFPPLAVAIAALAVSGGASLLAIGHERRAGVLFFVALAALALEEIVGLAAGPGVALPASPLESATFAVVAFAGIVASARQRSWPTARVNNMAARAAVLWALTIAGVGVAARIKPLPFEADRALDSAAASWGSVVALLVSLGLLWVVGPGERIRSRRTRVIQSALLAGWIVCAPAIITTIIDILVVTDDPVAIRQTVGWMVLALSAQAATGAAAMSWIMGDRELVRVANVGADGTIVVDQMGKIVHTDSGAAELFGWQPEQLQGQPLQVLIPGRYRPAHQHRTDAFMASPTHRTAGAASPIGLRQDGSEFEADVVLTPVDRGRLVAASVWEMRGETLALRKTRFRDRLVAVAEQSSHGFFIEDPDGIAVESNDALCRMLGESREQLLGASIVNRCLPADLVIVDEALGPMLAGQSDHAEWRARYRRDDDSWFWAELEVTRLLDEHGRAEGVSGQLRDVSAEVAERELRVATEGLLLAATEAAPIGLAVTNVDGFHQQVNQAYCDMTGYSADELAMCSVKSITEPGDWRDEQAACARLLAATGVTPPPVEVLDKRLERPDGTEVWVRLHVRTMLSSEGAVTGFVSQTIDISEAKVAEAAARVAQAELTFRSSHDSLTGVRNRANIIDVLTQLLTASKAGNVGLLFMDLDRFKQINDDISHAAGDQVLVEVANRLRTATRANDCIGRIGGDEFIVVLGDLTSPADAATVAEHIRGSISATEFTAEGIRFRLTASMGIAVSRPGQTAAELLRDADAALQLAKESGRDGSRLHDDDLKTSTARRKETAKLLKRAIADGAIQSWFQPIVDLADRHVVGMEAMARWVEPGAAPVRAAEFIEVAEQSGLVDDLGMTVIGQALAHLSVLPDTVTMAVNVAPAQLTRSSLGANIISLLSKLELNPDRLVIEVAAESLLALRAEARRDLEAMVSSGIKLHVTGFGRGDSSVSALRDYPVSGIKLDRSVVRHLGGDSEHSMVRLASGLGSLAKELGFTRIAEGIETEAQAQAARDAGWTLGQGWLFGEAEPAPELDPALRHSTMGGEHVIHNRRRVDSKASVIAQTRRLNTQSRSSGREFGAVPGGESATTEGAGTDEGGFDGHGVRPGPDPELSAI